jgi:putative FmdB family regulatory protein
LKCQELFEFLAVKSDDTMETRCPHCDAEDFERVMSSTNFAMGGGTGESSASKQTRTCSGGNCTTYEISGP